MKHYIASIGVAAGLICLSSTASANLIVNGDFEAGNTGFSSDYRHSPGDIVPAGVYDIVADPKSVHESATSYGDHTGGSGLMMAVNGETTLNAVVWGQTVTVDKDATYDFAAYLSSWTSTSPAQLAFSVNEVQIGSPLTASATTGEWDLFFATWQSGTATSAAIKIVNLNTAFSGNDFALDDLFFGDPIFSDPSGPPIAVSAPQTAFLILLGLAGLARIRRPGAAR